jgi:alanyl-tRNA synthetase
MANLYLTDTYLTNATLKVVFVHNLQDGTVAFALADNIGRPQGGGQPADRCSFTHKGIAFNVSRIYKQTAKPFHTVYEYAPSTRPPVAVGDFVDFSVDVERRLNLSRSHTLTHVAMAAIRRCVPDYQSRGAEILEDERTCRLWFTSDTEPSDADVQKITDLARSSIELGLAVQVVTEPSITAAEYKYEAWRVDSTLGLKGKIRVILIGEDWDANPCSGTHVKSTKEIRAFCTDGLSRNSQRECWELRVRTCNVWETNVR